MSERQAGRELDIEIAEKVMGWPVIRFGDARTDTPFPHVTIEPSTFLSLWRQAGREERWSPSRDIADAWELVERLGLWLIRDEGHWIACQPEPDDVYVDAVTGIIDGHLQNIAAADTAPLAICLAALKAMEPSR